MVYVKSESFAIEKTFFIYLSPWWARSLCTGFLNWNQRYWNQGHGVECFLLNIYALKAVNFLSPHTAMPTAAQFFRLPQPSNCRSAECFCSLPCLPLEKVSKALVQSFQQDAFKIPRIPTKNSNRNINKSTKFLKPFKSFKWKSYPPLRLTTTFMLLYALFFHRISVLIKFFLEQNIPQVGEGWARFFLHFHSVDCWRYCDENF